MERDETFILEDEEGRIFLLPTSSSHLSHNESDPFYPAFDYYSEWHEYSGLGWAMDKVYDNNPIQMLFAPW